MLTDAFTCLWLVAAISAVGVMVSSLEMFCIRPHFNDSGMFSWAVHRQRTEHVLKSRFIGCYDRIFTSPGLWCLNGIRLLGGVAVLFASHSHFFLLAACLVVAATSNLQTVRGGDGRSGADQLTCVTFTALSVGLLSAHPVVWKACIAFLAGQLAISYGTSGWIKVLRPEWRDGSYLRGVMRTHVYGHPAVHRLCSAKPSASRALGLLFIGFECALPFTLFCPPPVAYAMVLASVSFHASNAIFMGLNCFFWAFVALTPAYLFLNGILWGMVRG